MKAVGLFNGITASSLMLLSKKNIDYLYHITTRHLDEYMASELVEELKYLKGQINPDSIEEKYRLLFKDTDVRSITREAVLRGVGVYLYTNLISDPEYKKYTDAQDTVDPTPDANNTEDFFRGNNIFEQETDLFESLESTEESEEDLFSESEKQKEHPNSEQVVLGTSCSNPIYGGFRGIMLKSIPISVMLDVGFTVGLTESATFLFKQLLPDYTEIEKGINFLKVKFKNCGSKSMLKSFTDGDITINTRILEKYSQLVNANNNPNTLSLYKLSLEDILVVMKLTDKFIDDPRLIENPTLDFKLHKLIVSSSNEIVENNMSKLDYCIELFKMKAVDLGNSKKIILNTPVNRLYYAFSDYKIVEKAAALISGLRREPDITKALYEMQSQLTKAITYVKCLSESVDENIELDVQEVCNYIQRGGRDSSIILTREAETFISTAKSKEILPKVLSSVSQNRQDIEAIAITYSLYKMKHLFSLNELGVKLFTSISFEDLLQANINLVEKYNIIPITVDALMEEYIFQSHERLNTNGGETYAQVIPNLTLIQKHLDSLCIRGAKKNRMLGTVTRV